MRHVTRMGEMRVASRVLVGKPDGKILGKWPTSRTVLFYVFISVLYMFRATSCSSSGESIVSIQHLVCVILCRWSFRVQVGNFLSDLHTKRSLTQSDIYQMLYWYNWFSWWWARCSSKHVENWIKHKEKNSASSWSFSKKEQDCKLVPVSNPWRHTERYDMSNPWRNTRQYDVSNPLRHTKQYDMHETSTGVL